MSDLEKKLFEFSRLMRWFEDEGHHLWYDDGEGEFMVTADTGGRLVYSGETQYVVRPTEVFKRLTEEDD